MIIALPYKQGMLQAMDQTSVFALYHIENNYVVKKELIQPGVKGEALIEHLYRCRVNQVILPELSDSDKFDLDYYQMGYVTGVSGEADTLVEMFLEGAYQDDD